jgi:hypothetical protein
MIRQRHRQMRKLTINPSILEMLLEKMLGLLEQLLIWERSGF